MKLPGPDHPIEIAPHAKRVRVTFNGRTVADTTRALVLRETTYKPVFYIPREDADMAAFERTAIRRIARTRATRPTTRSASATSWRENAIWSYEQPFPAMADIAGRLAFYPNRVDAIEES